MSWDNNWLAKKHSPSCLELELWSTCCCSLACIFLPFRALKNESVYKLKIKTIFFRWVLFNFSDSLEDKGSYFSVQKSHYLLTHYSNFLLKNNFRRKWKMCFIEIASPANQLVSQPVWIWRDMCDGAGMVFFFHEWKSLACSEKVESPMLWSYGNNQQLARARLCHKAWSLPWKQCFQALAFYHKQASHWVDSCRIMTFL